MEGMEEISFQMIAAVGEAKSFMMEAIGLASDRRYDEARGALSEAKEKLSVAHGAHFELIQQEANGEKVALGLLFVHAEDQLMTIGLFYEVAEQMVRMYQKMYEMVDGKER